MDALSTYPKGTPSVAEPSGGGDGQDEDWLCHFSPEQSKADLGVWTGDRKFAMRCLECKTHQEFIRAAPGLRSEVERELPHVQAKRLKRVLTAYAPTFPGFTLYYPSRRQQPPKLKAFIDYAMVQASAR